MPAGPLSPALPLRKRKSCFWFTTKISLSVLVIFAIRFAYPLVKTAAIRFTDPYSELFLKDLEGSEGENTEIVKALVGKDDKFDIAASVWISTGQQGAMTTEAKPLYSDIIFRGVTLKDKGLLTSVRIKVPTMRL